jgi:hypothetical protein
VSAQPQMPCTGAPTNGATTGGCPYDWNHPLVGADSRVCPTANAMHGGAHQWGNHRGLPLRLESSAGRGRLPCLPNRKCHARGRPPMGQPQGVAPTGYHRVAPSPVGADPRVCPTANAMHGGAHQWGNHRGLPLRLESSAGRGRLPCLPNRKCHARGRPPMGQPQGVAPTGYHRVAPSPVGADPRVCPVPAQPCLPNRAVQQRRSTRAHWLSTRG